MSEMDLNLLRIFDTLIELRNATRAADRLGLTQSAVSHALGRLRRTIGDPLFVRGPEGLQPTARALEIAPGIRDGLARLRSAMAPSAFDLATAERRFVIAAGTHFCALLVPALAERARIEAPGITFRIVPVGDDLLASLDQGTVDLALGAFVKAPSRLVAETLYDEDLVWIAAVANPIARQSVTSEMLAQRPRIAISSGGALDGRSAMLGEGGLERQIIAAGGGALLDPLGEGTSSVYDAQTAVAIVARTDAVSLVPRRSALHESRSGEVAILDTVETAPAIRLSMLWHRKQSDDEGLVWLRKTLRDIG